MMDEIKTLTFKRAIVSDDAVNVDIQTLEFGDTSKEMAWAAVHARFQRKNGMYSSQVVLAWSKIVPENLSKPRAELFATVLNTYTAEVIKRAFYNHHKKSLKFTDSQTVLHWINNDESPFKEWVRNRVIKIRRFAKVEEWYYVDSANMIADIGTRKRSSTQDIKEDSEWIQGFEWIKGSENQLPMKSRNEVLLTSKEVKEMKDEIPCSIQQNCEQVHTNIIRSKVPNEVDEYYQHSKYLINPRKFKFSKVLRILSLIKRFIKILQEKSSGKAHTTSEEQFNTSKQLTVTEEEIYQAQEYFFRKATLKIKHFLKEATYKNITEERNGTLYYTGRILPTLAITAAGEMTTTMLDLSATTFCVPVTSYPSPITYSIANEVH